MPTQTDAQLTTRATTIKNNTADDSNNATLIGQFLTDLNENKVNIDKRPYKVFSAIVSFSSGPTFDVSVLQNDFGTTTFAFTNPAAGVVRVTASVATFTDAKTTAPGSSLNNAGTPYFVDGVYNTDLFFSFVIIKYDGTQTGTPFFTNQLFEIKVYN